jgi:hypothetical protein
LALDKGYEKKALEQQAAILGVMEKIEVLSKDTNQSVKHIEQIAIGSVEVDRKQLEVAKDSNKVLREIKAILQSSSKDKKSDSGVTEGKSAREKIASAASNFGETAKSLAVIAGALIIFGGAIAAINAIVTPLDVLKFLPFIAVVGIASFAFAEIAKGFAEEGVSKKDILNTGLLMVVVAGAIVAVGAVFAAAAFLGGLSPQNAPNPMWVIAAGFAVLAFSFSMSMLLKSIEGSLDTKTALNAGLIMVIIAGAIVATAYIFMGLPQVGPENAPNFLWAAATGLAVLAFSFGMYSILKALKDASLGIKDVVIAGLAMVVIAAVIVATAHILTKIPQVGPDQAPDLLWAAKAGLSLALFTFGFIMISKYTKDLSLKTVALVALSMIAVAGVVLATAFLFQYLPDTMKYPSIEFSLGAGLAVAIFGIGFALLSKVTSTMQYGDIIKTVLTAVAIAGVILAVSWIFSYLPDELRAPSIEFTLGAAVGLGIMGVLLAGLGLLMTTLTPAVFGFGILAVLLSALAIVGVAWIFTLLPSSLFEPGGLIYKATDAIYYFGSKMVDLFSKLAGAIINGMVSFFTAITNFVVKLAEVGPVNLIALGGGLVSLAAGIAAVSAAIAGGGLASGVASAGTAVAGFVSSGISKVSDFLFGGGGMKEEGSKAVSPYNAILTLAAQGKNVDFAAKAVSALANAVKAFSGPLTSINSSLGSATTQMIAFIQSVNSNATTNFLPPSKLIEALTDSTEYLHDAMEELGDQTSYAKNEFDQFKNIASQYVSVFVGNAKSPGFISGLIGGSGRPVTVIDEIVLGMKGMNDFISKIVSQQSPLQKIARTFEDIAESMEDYIDAVNSVNVAKMTALNDQLKIMQKFNQPGISQSFEAVKGLVDKLIDLEKEKSSSLINIETGGGSSKAAEISEASMIMLANRIAQSMGQMKVIITDPNTGRSLGVVGRLSSE